MNYSFLTWLAVYGLYFHICIENPVSLISKAFGVPSSWPQGLLIKKENICVCSRLAGCLYARFSHYKRQPENYERKEDEEERKHLAPCLFVAVVGNYLWTGLEAHGMQRQVDRFLWVQDQSCLYSFEPFRATQRDPVSKNKIENYFQTPIIYRNTIL